MHNQNPILYHLIFHGKYKQKPRGICNEYWTADRHDGLEDVSGEINIEVNRGFGLVLFNFSTCHKLFYTALLCLIRHIIVFPFCFYLKLLEFDKYFAR